MAFREVSKEVTVKVGKPATPVKLTLPEPSCPVVAGVVLTHGAGGDMDSSYLPRLAAALAVEGVSCVRFTCRTLHLPTRVNAIQAVLSEAASSWSETAAVPCWFCAGHSMGGRAACQVAYSNWQQQEQEQERRQKKQQEPPQVEEKEKGQGVVTPAKQKTRTLKKRNQAATAPGETALTSAARGAMKKMTKRTRGANGRIACVVQGSGSGGEEGPGGGGGGGGGSSGAQRLILPEAESARDCSGAGPSAAGNAGPPRIVGCVLLSYPLHPPDKPDQLRDDPLCKLRCPLLFVRGSRDEFSQEKLFAGVMERMVSTHVQVHTVEGGDHSLKVPRGKRKRWVDDSEHVLDEAVQDRDAGREDTDQLQEVFHAVISFVKVVAGGAWVRAKAENKSE